MNGVFVRVWEYEVPRAHHTAFIIAYGADGAWAELFGRSRAYLGTELFREGHSYRFLTIDRWVDEWHWRSFLDEFHLDYVALDRRLEGLATSERSLFEGHS
jgi:hypothetical protein